MSFPTRHQILNYLDTSGIRSFLTASYDAEDLGLNILFVDNSEIAKAAAMLMELPEVRDVIVAELNMPVLKIVFQQPEGDSAVPAPRVGT